MRVKFFSFFALVGITGLLSICDSWILQYQARGGISVVRAIFDICLLIFVLYFLWNRSSPSYVLALVYTIGYAGLYGYELGNDAAQLGALAIIVSIGLVVSAVGALSIFALDYADYRRRRIPIDK